MINQCPLHFHPHLYRHPPVQCHSRKSRNPSFSQSPLSFRPKGEIFSSPPIPSVISTKGRNLFPRNNRYLSRRLLRYDKCSLLLHSKFKIQNSEFLSSLSFRPMGEIFPSLLSLFPLSYCLFTFAFLLFPFFPPFPKPIKLNQ